VASPALALPLALALPRVFSTTRASSGCLPNLNNIITVIVKKEK